MLENIGIGEILVIVIVLGIVYFFIRILRKKKPKIKKVKSQ